MEGGLSLVKTRGRQHVLEVVVQHANTNITSFILRFAVLLCRFNGDRMISKDNAPFANNCNFQLSSGKARVKLEQLLGHITNINKSNCNNNNIEQHNRHE